MMNSANNIPIQLLKKHQHLRFGIAQKKASIANKIKILSNRKTKTNIIPV